MSKILIIENEDSVSKLIAEKVIQHGYTVCFAKENYEAVNQLEKEKPSIVIIDASLSEFDGVSLVKKIRDLYAHIQIIVITGHGKISAVLKSINIGSSNYLQNHKDIEEISKAVNNTYRAICLMNKIKGTSASIMLDSFNNEIIGDRTEIYKINKLLSILTTNKKPIFIKGPVGTGKNIIANIIHEQSEYKKKKFVLVDCNELTESLFESKLLGHEKGSFNEAIGKHKGFLERAEGGTIFFENITSLELDQQKKLLDIIKSKKITRIGSNTPIDININIICSSSLNVFELIDKDEFLFDLYYNVSNIIITMPTFNDRKDNLTIFANYLLKEGNKKLDKQIKSFSEDSLSLLIEHEWTGNIKEFITVIKKAILFETTDTIHSDHIYIKRECDFKKIIINDELNMLNKVNEYKEQLVHNALLISDNDKEYASELLGISWRQLYRYLEL